MKLKIVIAFAGVAALAACGGTNDTNIAAPAGSVAAVAPPAGQKWSETVAATEEGFRMGNPNAPIKLVEYGARLCPTCGRFASEGFQPLVANYVETGKVSFEFRDFLIHGPSELALAALGRCAGPGPFFPILEQMFANQEQFVRKMETLTPAQQQALQGKSPVALITALADAIGAVDFVKQRGIPEAQARGCIDSEAKLKAVAAPTEKASNDGTVTGTPTFILNGQKIDAATWTGVETALKASGA